MFLGLTNVAATSVHWVSADAFSSDAFQGIGRAMSRITTVVKNCFCSPSNDMQHVRADSSQGWIEVGPLQIYESSDRSEPGTSLSRGFGVWRGVSYYDGPLTPTIGSTPGTSPSRGFGAGEDASWHIPTGPIPSRSAPPVLVR